MLTNNAGSIAVLGVVDAGPYRALRFEDAPARELAEVVRREPGYRLASRADVVDALESHPELERDGDVAAVLHNGTMIAMGHHCDAGMHRSPGVVETIIHPGDLVTGTLILLVAER